MTAPEVVFYVSDVRVVVSTPDEHVRDALALVWGAAGPILSPARTVRGRIEVVSGEADVRLDDSGMACAAVDAVAAFEELLYDRIPSWHAPPRVLLHAAAVRCGRTVLVLLGPSG